MKPDADNILHMVGTWAVCLGLFWIVGDPDGLQLFSYIILSAWICYLPFYVGEEH